MRKKKEVLGSGDESRMRREWNGLRRGESVLVVSRELIVQNHECLRRRPLFYIIKKCLSFFSLYSSQNLPRERRKKKRSKQSKTQGVCSPVQAQGRAPLAPVSPLWVVGKWQNLAYSLIAMCLLLLYIVCRNYVLPFSPLETSFQTIPFADILHSCSQDYPPHLSFSLTPILVTINPFCSSKCEHLTYQFLFYYGILIYTPLFLGTTNYQMPFFRATAKWMVPNGRV